MDSESPKAPITGEVQHGDIASGNHHPTSSVHAAATSPTQRISAGLTPNQLNNCGYSYPNDDITVLPYDSTHGTPQYDQAELESKGLEVGTSGVLVYNPPVLPNLPPSAPTNSTRTQRWNASTAIVMEWISRIKRKLAKRKHKPRVDKYNFPIEDFLRTVEIALVVDGHEIIWHGRALFDSGVKSDHICRGFVESKFGIQNELKVGGPSLTTLGGHSYNSVGLIKGRWAGQDKMVNKKAIHFHEHKFHDGCWHVSESMKEGFDVIFGRDTILGLNLMDSRPGGYMGNDGFRRKPQSPLKDKKLDQHREQQKRKIEAQQKLKEAHLKRQREIDAQRQEEYP